MDINTYDASKLWQKELALDGTYEHHCYSKYEMEKLKRLGQVWHRILKVTKLKQKNRVFELGCGGGIHLARLALNGFEVHGIDVSSAVANRAQNFLKEVSEFQPIEATVEVANIFEYQSSQLYDMCYHFGVVEHFLELSQRQEIWKKLYSLTKPGGWIVSVVPCGQHLMRSMAREHGLAGYNIPEIDYSCSSHRKEFEDLDLQRIYALPHNYFSFFSAHPLQLVSKVIYPVSFILGNITIPFLPLSEKVKETWAQTLIVIGRKETV